MAYLLSQGDEDIIHATTHGLISQEDLGFLRDRMDYTLRSAGAFPSKYLAAAGERLATFNLGRVKARVDAMRDRFGRRWDEDRVLAVVDLSGFQDAKSVMRGYLMAEPRTRRLFHQGRLDGYGDLYADEDPQAIGRTHTPYREVMNGAYDETVEDEDRFITYLGVDEVLTQPERDMVRRSWRELVEHLDRGQQDPTSPLRKTL